MKILGIHIGHDPSAVLVVDGQIVVDVAEERFARIKHFVGLLIEAILYCLKTGRVSIEDIDVIAIPKYARNSKYNFLLGIDEDKKKRKNFLSEMS